MSQRILNERLINARLNNHWTQEEACEHVGVPNVRTWQRWETEGVQPSPYFRKRLCDVFSLSLEDLGIHLRGKRSYSAEENTSIEIEDERGDKADTASLELSLTDVEVAVFQELLMENNVMKRFDPSRRAAITKMFQTTAKLTATYGAVKLLNHAVEPFERLALASTQPLELDDVSLLQFEQLIAQGWELSNSSQLKVAEGVLATFLPEILDLSSQNSRTVRLASQGLRLQSMLTHHQLKIADKVLICEHAVEYARHANDADTLVAALLELAIAYKYNNQTEKWFKVLQEALYYTPQASQLVQSQAYLKSASAFAHYKREREAEFYIQMGLDTFPDHPEDDRGYALADSNIYTLSRDVGRAQLALGKISASYGAFDIYKSAGLVIPERLRLEIVNGQSKTAILENDLEKYAHFLRDGLSGAVALGSKKRFDEAYNIYKEDMPEAWLEHGEVQQIAEQYHLMRV